MTEHLCPACPSELVFPKLPHSDIPSRPNSHLWACQMGLRRMSFEGLGKDSHEKSGLETGDDRGRHRHRLPGIAAAQCGMNLAALTKQTEPPPANAAIAGPNAPDAGSSTTPPIAKSEGTAEPPSNQSRQLGIRNQHQPVPRRLPRYCRERIPSQTPVRNR